MKKSLSTIHWTRLTIIESLLGLNMLIVAAFCTDWRLGLFVVAIALLWLGYISSQMAITARIEEVNNAKTDRAVRAIHSGISNLIQNIQSKAAPDAPAPAVAPGTDIKS